MKFSADVRKVVASVTVTKFLRLTGSFGQPARKEKSYRADEMHNKFFWRERLQEIFKVRGNATEFFCVQDFIEFAQCKKSVSKMKLVSEHRKGRRK